LVAADSMTDSSLFFLYTPVPYLIAMYLVAYRHDLTRVSKPFRDLARLREWWSVCKHLGLVSAGAKRPTEPFALGTRNLLLFVASVVTYTIPFLVPFPLPWYYLCVAQTAVAIPLFTVIVLSWTGPLPFKPYRDVLPYPRMGTRIRHLGESSGETTV
jgi:hypothetical protein